MHREPHGATDVNRPIARTCWALFFCATAAAVAAQTPGPATLENLLQPGERPPLQLRQKQAPDTKVAVPDEKAVSMAVELIRQAYEEDFERAADAPEPLIQKLLAAAAQTNDPARKYATLLQAQEVAIRGGDYGRAFEIVDIRTTEFDAEPAQARLDVLATLLTPKTKTNPEILESLYEHAIETADRALTTGNPSAAKVAADLAVGIARNLQLLGRSRRLSPLIASGDDKLRSAQELAKTLQKRVAAIKDVEEARQTLERQPDDPDANGVVGRYLCFLIGDWGTGLPMLAKTGNKELKEIAMTECSLLQEQSPDRDKLFKLAERWWRYAESEDAERSEATVIKKHAGAMYGAIVEQLQDPLEAQLARTRFTKSGATQEDADSVMPHREARTSTTIGEPARVAAPPAANTEGRDDRQKAIERSLAWLTAHQMPDGSWSFDHRQATSCKGQCGQGGVGTSAKDTAAATALTLLAFYRSGHSHKEGAHKATMLKGLAYLSSLAVQGNGQCYAAGGTMYSQGCAALALCEAYRITKDSRVRRPAQAALDFIQQAQDPAGGGWRYSPRQAGDTSATGWQVAALAVGKSAGLAVQPAVLVNAGRFLDSVQTNNGAAYGYTSPGAGAGTTAVGLLCRSYLGAMPDQPPHLAGLERLGEMGPSRDLYFTYYGTQVLHRAGGGLWTAWTTKAESMLLESQSTTGHEAGSWFEGVSSGHGASVAGRIYCTTLSTMILSAGGR